MKILQNIPVWPVIAALVLGLAIDGASRSAAAEEPVFQVSVDRTTIGQDESIALKFKVVTSSMGSGEDPEFEAPDFDVVNQYSSVFVESFYENGKFGARNNRQFTKVLRPNRMGDLVISGIRLRTGGRVIEHPSIKITVTAAGRGTQPPQGYGGGGAGLRGAGKRPRGATLPFFVKTEVDHSRVVKGQQVIVSYYLYQRARVHNIQVEKYPVLDGFLREDLELPILGQRLTDREAVVLDGVAYERVLLARYAAYPLKEGRLSIDSMAIKANYFAPPGGLGDSEDPVSDVLQNFMQQLQPRSWSHRSDPVQVEVQPLPLDGRPTSFTGGVGDFEVTSVIDKSTVKVNEPVTVVVKIEGRGNIGAIGQPPVKWPAELEVYETKSKVTGSPGATPAKIFEILLIPRKAGRFTLPGMELGYFSPSDGTYKVKKAGPIEIVAEGQAGSPEATSGATSGRAASERPGSDDLLLPEQWTSRRSPGSPLARWIVQGLVVLSGLVLAGIVARRLWRRRHMLGTLRDSLSRSRKTTAADLWRALQAKASRSSELDRTEVVSFYQRASEGLYSELESHFALPARAWSRAEIRRQIEERTADSRPLIEPSLWQRIENILEYGEAVQFSGVLEEQEARSRMEATLREIERIVGALGSPAGERG